MSGHIERDFVVFSSKRGRLTYCNTRKDASKQLKLWKASADKGDIVYLENTTGKREYSLDGTKWTKTNPIPREKLTWLENLS